jgi:hypothetical protein
MMVSSNEYYKRLPFAAAMTAYERGEMNPQQRKYFLQKNQKFIVHHQGILPQEYRALMRLKPKRKSTVKRKR